MYVENVQLLNDQERRLINASINVCYDDKSIPTSFMSIDRLNAVGKGSIAIVVLFDPRLPDWFKKLSESYVYHIEYTVPKSGLFAVSVSPLDDENRLKLESFYQEQSIASLNVPQFVMDYSKLDHKLAHLSTVVDGWLSEKTALRDDLVSILLKAPLDEPDLKPLSDLFNSFRCEPSVFDNQRSPTIAKSRLAKFIARVRSIKSKIPDESNGVFSFFAKIIPLNKLSVVCDKLIAVYEARSCHFEGVIDPEVVKKLQRHDIRIEFVKTESVVKPQRSSGFSAMPAPVRITENERFEERLHQLIQRVGVDESQRICDSVFQSFADPEAEAPLRFTPG